MIKNFKWLLILSLAMTACSDDEETTAEVLEPVTPGSADFSRYVALGNSLTAGYGDNALYISGQQNSYPAILARQFEMAGGGPFSIPFMNDNTGGMLFNGTQILGPRLYFNGAAPVPVPGVPTTEVTQTLQGPFNNMGVPGAKSFHLLAPSYGNPAGVPGGSASPYYARFASSATSTLLGDAVAQNPTFFTLWIGNNDVLSYATSGGVGTNQIGNPDPSTYQLNDITDPNVFATAYTGIVDALTANGAKGVVGNIPYVTSIPFFTTVPFSPLTAATIGGGNQAVGEATINQLNTQLYGPLKQALTAFGAGDRIQLLSTTQGNPLLIKDETLPDLSAQLTAAFTPVLGAPTAAFYGQVFGRARHATSTDLVLLTTQSAIGTAPVGVPAPLDKYGITYPLEDSHILIPAEIEELKTATDAYNVTIANVAQARNLGLVDANALLNQLFNGGIPYENYILKSDFVFGGAFSLDGIHPTSRGYALIANEFIREINETYGATLRTVKLTDYPVLRPAVIE